MLNLTKAQLSTLTKASKIMEQLATYDDEKFFSSPTIVADYCNMKIGYEEVEKFVVMYLDTQNKLIESIIESSGTINAASVYPRNIAKRALELNAASVILAHNHPSGVCYPSEADRKITTQISKALALFSINVLDHVIVGRGESYSFANHGESL